MAHAAGVRFADTPPALITTYSEYYEQTNWVEKGLDSSTSWVYSTPTLMMHVPPRLCMVRSNAPRQGKGSHLLVDAKMIVHSIRLTVRLLGGPRGYGLQATDLGARSIQSGAAMSLFLSDDSNSIERIMILGRWSSDAFLVYIRPQVMEWTNNMSKEMARAGNFKDLNMHGRRVTRPDRTPVGRNLVIPRFNLTRR